MKRCSTCHEVKTLDAFNIRRSEADGRQPRCRECCQAWYQAHRGDHMVNVAARNRRAKAKHQARLAAYLSEHPCVDCGQDDLRLLEFDHRPGEQKLGNVTQMLNELFAWERVLAEIEKCDVRCANCHRIRTLERGNYWRHRWFVAQQQEVDVSARLRALFPA